MKTKPCEYCHKLPLKAGGCNILCLKGSLVRMILAIEAMRIGGVMLEKLINRNETNNTKRNTRI